MKIAQITSVYLSVPPRSHGGTELVVYHLTEGLAARGHSVELFASGDSRVSCPVNSVVPVATSYDPGTTSYIDKEMETRNTFNLYRQAHRFDIIHGHWPCLAAYFSSYTRTPTVLTYAYIEKHLHDYYCGHFPNVNPVCVSHAQARALGDGGMHVVYNGVDVEGLPFNPSPEDFLVIVGRIVPNKGIAEAIKLARAAGERLVIVGHVPPQIPWSVDYYEKQVRPFIDGDQIKHIPELPNAEVAKLVSRAKAFLFPLQWDEPFGLAVVEAMAAGTPVITYPRGSMPELVRDGETGFLVDNDNAALDAIKRVHQIDRVACRSWVAGKFTIDNMVSGYERVYNDVLEKANG